MAKVGKALKGVDGRDRASIDRGQSAAIRNWARRKGYNVAARGRIPEAVIESFRVATER